MRWASFSGGSWALLAVIFLMSYFDKWDSLGWFGGFMLFIAGIGAIFTDLTARGGTDK